MAVPKAARLWKFRKGHSALLVNSKGVISPFDTLVADVLSFSHFVALKGLDHRDIGITASKQSASNCHVYRFDDLHSVCAAELVRAFLPGPVLHWLKSPQHYAGFLEAVLMAQLPGTIFPEPNAVRLPVGLISIVHLPKPHLNALRNTAEAGDQV